MENVFEKGCLVQLSISMWGARRKIDQGKLARMTMNHEWLHATKKLVDPESLKPITKLAGSARLYLNTVSLPFPIHGMVFVPKDLISQVDEKLRDFQADFQSKVNDFVSRYPELRDSAIVYLGDLFNQLDYPVDVSRRFRLNGGSLLWMYPTAGSDFWRRKSMSGKRRSSSGQWKKLGSLQSRA